MEFLIPSYPSMALRRPVLQHASPSHRQCKASRAITAAAASSPGPASLADISCCRFYLTSVMLSKKLSKRVALLLCVEAARLESLMLTKHLTYDVSDVCHSTRGKLSLNFTLRAHVLFDRPHGSIPEAAPCHLRSVPA